MSSFGVSKFEGMSSAGKTFTHGQAPRRRVSVPIKTKTRRSRLDNLLETIEEENFERPAPEPEQDLRAFQGMNVDPIKALSLPLTPPRTCPEEPLSPLPPIPKTPFSDYKGTINIRRRIDDPLWSPCRNCIVFGDGKIFPLRSIFASPVKEKSDDAPRASNVELASSLTAARCRLYNHRRRTPTDGDENKGGRNQTLSQATSRKRLVFYKVVRIIGVIVFFNSNIVSTKNFKSL